MSDGVLLEMILACEQLGEFRRKLRYAADRVVRSTL